MVFRNPPPPAIIGIAPSGLFGAPGQPGFGVGFWGNNDIGLAQPGLVVDSGGFCHLQGIMKLSTATAGPGIAINSLPAPFDGVSHQGLVMWELVGGTARRADLIFQAGNFGWCLLVHDPFGVGTYMALEAISYYVGTV